MTSGSENTRLGTLVGVAFLSAVAPAIFTVLAGLFHRHVDLRLVTFAVNYGIFILCLCIGFCIGLPDRLNAARWVRIVLMIAVLVSGCLLIFKLLDIAEQRLAIKISDGFLLLGAMAGEILRKSQLPSPLDGAPKPN